MKTKFVLRAEEVQGAQYGDTLIRCEYESTYILYGSGQLWASFNMVDPAAFTHVTGNS